MGTSIQADTGNFMNQICNGIYKTDGVTVHSTTINELVIYGLAELSSTIQRIASQIFEFDFSQTILLLIKVPPGKENASTDYKNKISIRYSNKEQIEFSSNSMMMKYALGHEMGHMILGKACDYQNLPPIVWDEAWAHFCAMDVFFPQLMPKANITLEDVISDSSSTGTTTDGRRGIQFSWDYSWSLNEAYHILQSLKGSNGPSDVLKHVMKICQPGLTSADCARRLTWST